MDERFEESDWEETEGRMLDISCLSVRNKGEVIGEELRPLGVSRKHGPHRGDFRLEDFYG